MPFHCKESAGVCQIGKEDKKQEAAISAAGAKDTDAYFIGFLPEGQGGGAGRNRIHTKMQWNLLHYPEKQ